MIVDYQDQKSSFIFHWQKIGSDPNYKTSRESLIHHGNLRVKQVEKWYYNFKLDLILPSFRETEPGAFFKSHTYETV